MSLGVWKRGFRPRSGAPVTKVMSAMTLAVDGTNNTGHDAGTHFMASRLT